MKKAANKKVKTRKGELLPEYDLDYARSKPNRFASVATGTVHAVVLEPDVAAAFPNAKQVNRALRSLIKPAKQPSIGPQRKRGSAASP